MLSSNTVMKNCTAPHEYKCESTVQCSISIVRITVSSVSLASTIRKRHVSGTFAAPVRLTLYVLPELEYRSTTGSTCTYRILQQLHLGGVVVISRCTLGIVQCTVLHTVMYFYTLVFGVSTTSFTGARFYKSPVPPPTSRRGDKFFNYSNVVLYTLQVYVIIQNSRCTVLNILKQSHQWVSSKQNHIWGTPIGCI